MLKILPLFLVATMAALLGVLLWGGGAADAETEQSEPGVTNQMLWESQDALNAACVAHAKHALAGGRLPEQPHTHEEAAAILEEADRLLADCVAKVAAYILLIRSAPDANLLNFAEAQPLLEEARETLQVADSTQRTLKGSVEYYGEDGAYCGFEWTDC